MTDEQAAGPPLIEAADPAATAADLLVVVLRERLDAAPGATARIAYNIKW